jgi:hypoxia up-regulated 1
VSCEVEGSGKAESIGDSVKDWLGFGKKKDQEPLSDEEDTGPTEAVEAETSTSTESPESSTSSTTSASTSSSKAPEKPKKRTESITIALHVVPQGNPQPSADEMKRMSDRLAAFDRSDKARVAREEALNVLESFTYFVRDFLSNEDYEPFSTKAQRTEVSKLLDKTREFMESPKDISKATKDTLIEKHDQLKRLVDPIMKRRKEELARPEKVAALKTSLEQTQKLVDMIREQVKSAAEAKSKAEEFDASQSASATESTDAGATTPAPSDDLADLEEPDTQADPESTPAAITPKYKDASDFSPYTDLDLSEITDAFDSVTKWLAEKEAAQAKLKPHEEPVLLVKDVEKKATELSEIMKDLLYKKMKAPPKSASKKTKTSKTKSSKKGKSTATATESAVDEESTAAERPPESSSTSRHDEL